MNIILLGSPGVGKGTEANLLSSRMSLDHISTGDMLRQEVKENTGLGKEAQSFMNQGKLVPDKVIMAMVEKRLRAKIFSHGFVLDGVPRTLNQAEVLQELLKQLDMTLDFVIELDAQEEVLIERLSGRRVCKKCHALYHVTNMKPKKEGACDKCGSELYQRDDDKVATIKRRLDIYHKETQPLKEFYKNKNLLLTINADKEVEETFNKIHDCLTIKK